MEVLRSAWAGSRGALALLLALAWQWAMLPLAKLRPGGCSSHVGMLRAARRGQLLAMASSTPGWLCRHVQAAARLSCWRYGMLLPAAARKLHRLTVAVLGSSGAVPWLLMLMLLLKLRHGLVPKMGVRGLPG